MSIEISIIKSPEHIQPGKVCQIFTERGGSIGRGDGNTWTIEDPERFISSTHTQIEYENGAYYLADVSTNGTFYNGSSEPIGNGNRVILHDGDNFTLGDYEFRVNLNEPAYDIEDDPFANADFAQQAQFESLPQQNDDPFAVPALGHVPVSELYTPVSANETDPLALLDNIAPSAQWSAFQSGPSHTQADNADAIQQAVAWPNVIPDDWDAEPDVSRSVNIAPTPPASDAKPRFDSLIDEPQFHEVIKKLKQSEQRNAKLQDENQRLLHDVMQLKQKLKNLQKARPRKEPLPESVKVDATLISALGFDDRNLSEEKKKQISAASGYLVRESINGLMQTLGFRKRIKEEFRINVTTIQPVENNPLKFSANIDDALENMFIKDNKAYMGPLEAVQEGFQGIAEHQLALLAGIQAAFRGMIDRLDPQSLEKRFEKYRKTGVIKVGQKGKNWESYREFHQDLVNNIDNSFQYLFGYDFVQAYEEQLQRLLVARKSGSVN